MPDNYTSMEFSRRQALAATAAFMVTVSIGGSVKRVAAAEARRLRIPPAFFTAEEAATLEALADHLVPGAAAAGIAHYIGDQLIKPPADSLLMIRYMDLPPPYDSFYRLSLAALNDLAQANHGKPYRQLTETYAADLAAAVYHGKADPWNARIPAAFFGFILRADAIDATYGTMDGFARLGIPYAGHIDPVSKW